MQSFLFTLLFISISLVPVFVGAQVGQLGTTPQSSSIVSCSGVTAQNGLPACNLCNLVQLIGNLIQYSIYLAVMIASLMFAYAGFLFLTNNGSEQNITKAKNIFKRSIFGIIAILAAWLIVNAIMTKLATNLDLGENWNSITGCAEETVSSVPLANVNIVRGTSKNPFFNQNSLVYTNSAFDSEAKLQAPTYTNTFSDLVDPPSRQNAFEGIPKDSRQIPLKTRLTSIDRSTKASNGISKLTNAGIGISSTGGCTINRKNCTYIDGLNKNTLDLILQLRKSCPNCKLTVTGAGEVHSSGAYSHGNGYKFDISTTGSVNEFFKGHLIRDGSRKNGDPRYKDLCGNVYVREASPPHWDIKALKAPSARCFTR